MGKWTNPYDGCSAQIRAGSYSHLTSQPSLEVGFDEVLQSELTFEPRRPFRAEEPPRPVQLDSQWCMYVLSDEYYDSEGYGGVAPVVYLDTRDLEEDEDFYLH